MVHLKRAAIVALCLAAADAAVADSEYPPLEMLLQTDKTVIGQPFEYPSGTAQITAAIVTMAPGESTGWHVHDAPLFAHILQGEITVDYGPDGPRVYKTGDSIVEAFKTRHNGTNTGAVPVRILAVFAGVEGVPNTVSEK
ncbi:cupin domain-containing protein [Chachezhania antarctica]|uniref:cupin domain-containing protein n=1 Tax=Chachezhania antarctica TaxID=2340860 RepID=UPI000EAD2426|nr:cupin domain-containing protein [Chachezhania antarctica]